MNIDFIKIFTDSFSLVIKNKYIWFLGLLGPGFYGAGGGFSGSNFMGGFPQSGSEEDRAAMNELLNGVKEASQSFDTFLQDYGVFVFLGAVLFFAISLGFTWLYSRFFNANVAAILKIEKDEKSSIKQAFADSKTGTGSIFLVKVFMRFFNFLLIAPVIYYSFQAFINYDFAELKGLLYFIPFYLIMAVVGIFAKALAQLSIFGIAIDGLTFMEAKIQSITLLKTKFKEIAFMWLLGIVAGMVIGVASIVIYMVVMFGGLIVFGALGFLAVAILGEASFIVVTIIILTALILFMLIVMTMLGMVSSFYTASWVNLYQKITQKA